ncbi:hypothetical protein U27_03481 [Candidatus Vecturithrix granuli]|uniref:DUF1468 domain-containing protein n=1 Tax=Vecturithrix granuli TaxID=1499967 RepID=A0A081BW14_VECG1|nr:hypothetical protein U27_03481 [Candidatus Vecturithrix granuli]
MNVKQMVKADFIVSIVIILFSLFLIFESIVMPRYEEWGLYATPGLAPLVFSLLLLFTGIILFIRSLLQQGYKIRLRREHFSRLFNSVQVQRFLAVFGLIILYALLLGKVHFVILSTVYVLCTIFYFRSTRWWINLLISVSMSVAVWVLFSRIFLVPLP